MIQVFDDHGNPIRLTQKIGEGNEGEVFAVDSEPSLVAKIYKGDRGLQRADKIKSMIDAELFRDSTHVAFPTVSLFDGSREFVGFLMKKVDEVRPIHELWDARNRKERFPEATVAFMARVATNVARAVSELHSRGCVIGDINETGFLVRQDATVAVVDSDSFQFRTPQKTYRCLVGTPIYLPPEHQGADRGKIEYRTPDHDNFGLAVFIFRMLMAGSHPFIGRWHGKGDPPNLESRIRDFRYAYGTFSSKKFVGPQPSAPPIAWVPQKIRKYFERAFSPEGTGKRPSANEWVPVLDEFESQLIECGSSDFHFHSSGSSICPWCKTEEKRGVRLFGEVEPDQKQRPYTPRKKPKANPGPQRSSSSSTSHSSSVGGAYKSSRPQYKTSPRTRASSQPKSATPFKSPTAKFIERAITGGVILIFLWIAFVSVGSSFGSDDGEWKSTRYGKSTYLRAGQTSNSMLGTLNSNANANCLVWGAQDGPESITVRVRYAPLYEGSRIIQNAPVRELRANESFCTPSNSGYKYVIEITSRTGQAVLFGHREYVRIGKIGYNDIPTLNNNHILIHKKVLRRAGRN